MLFRTKRKGQHLGVAVSADGVANNHLEPTNFLNIETSTINYPAPFGSLESSPFRLPAHCLLLF